MAKKIKAIIKLQIPAGQANPAPPVGPALGQHGVNIMAFCKEYNERTTKQSGSIIPVEITVYADRSFTFITKTPPTTDLLKKALIATMKSKPKNYTVVVSSDLSHYHSHVEAQSYDKTLIQDIRKVDSRSFFNNIQSRNSEACGFGGILTALMFIKEAGKGKSAILHYMDSGEVSGDRKKVVGYVSASLY